MKLNWIVIGLVPPGGTPYSGLYGESPPKGGTFFRLQVYERVAVSPIEGYQLLKSVKGPKGANRRILRL